MASATSASSSVGSGGRDSVSAAESKRSSGRRESWGWRSWISVSISAS